MASTTASATSTAPRRGGTHPIYGIYLGGAPLDVTYNLTAAHPFHHMSQERSPKQSNTNGSTLISAMEDNTKPKFTGNLDLTTSSATEYDKDSFIRAVKEKVKYYGLHNFFYIQTGGTMTYLLDNPHDLTCDEVHADYKDRVKQLVPVMTTDTTPVETPESIAARHKSYDIYELSDRSLSRLAVESLLSSGFREQILNRFSHEDNFDELPGQVYFMMAMDTCLASASVDIDGAKAHFKELSLDSYPGENVAAFSVVALKLIKIMKGAYAIDIKIGSKLLRKVDHTQSDYFNRKIHGFLDTTRAMESKYLFKDPKTMTTDTDYAEYGPIGLCGLISKTYGDLYKEGDWPTVSATKKIQLQI